MFSEANNELPMIFNWRQEPAYIPARKVITRSTHRVIGQHASYKTSSLMPWESQIENLYLRQLEVDPDILEFIVQPYTFEFPDTSYTPDVLVRSRTSEYYVEVKPDGVFDDEVTLSRIRTLQQYFQEFGTELRLVTKGELMRQPLLTNVNNLMRLVRKELKQETLHSILEICGLEWSTIGEILSRSKGILRKVDILLAVVRGYLLLDLNEPITAETVVQPYDWS